MSVTCYPSPGKVKAMMMCQAFARGCGGVLSDPRKGLRPGAAFFYGVVPETRALFNQARAEGRDWFYADNSYFDRGRQGYFRVTRNDFQVSDVMPPSYARLDDLGVKVKPWRETGDHIVLCEQSAAFMELCGYKGSWTRDALLALEGVGRPIRVRQWDRDKNKMMGTLKSDLVNAWALVTHMSAAANEALLVGVPVFVTGACAAAPVASGTVVADLVTINAPEYPGGRSEWAAGLAGQQWTVDEIKSGKCWRDLNG
jgi:hypothetical protein